MRSTANILALISVALFLGGRVQCDINEELSHLRANLSALWGVVKDIQDHHGVHIHVHSADDHDKLSPTHKGDDDDTHVHMHLHVEEDGDHHCNKCHRGHFGMEHHRGHQGGEHHRGHHGGEHHRGHHGGEHHRGHHDDGDDDHDDNHQKNEDEAAAIDAHCNVVPNWVLRGRRRFPKIFGHIHFHQKINGGPVHLDIDLEGFDPIQGHAHGFHIHEFGNMSVGCRSLGSHYNPENKNHGGRKSAERHVGDLGNIVCDGDGRVHLGMTDEGITLIGERSIIGRSVVIHAYEDDRGQGKDRGSRQTGNSGERLACCVITLVQ